LRETRTHTFKHLIKKEKEGKKSERLAQSRQEGIKKEDSKKFGQVEI